MKRPGRPLRAFLLLCLFAAAAALPFARDIPLHDSWRGLIVEEFKKRGIELTLEGVAVSPFEGVVARGVVLYEGAERRKKLAEADRLGLGVDWYKLAAKRHFLDLIDLRGGRIEVGGPGGMAVELSDVHARLHLAERQARVSGFRARLMGVQVSASGTLLNHGEFRLPEAAQESAAPATAPGAALPANLAASPAALLGRLRAGEASRINIEFSGDLSRPETVEVLGRALLEDVSLGIYKAERVRCEFRFTGGGRVELRRFEIADRLGELAATGVLHPNAGAFTLQAESGIDLAGLARAVSAVAAPGAGLFPDGLEIKGAQRLSAAVSSQPDRLEVTGRVSVGDIVYKHLRLSAEASFSTDGKRLMIRKLAVDDGRGRLAGDLLFSGGQTRAALRSTLNPEILKPFFSGRPRAALDEWRFRDAPEIEFEAAARGLDPATAAGSGKLRLGRTIYRGVAIREASSDIAYARGAFTYSRLWVERPEGFLSGRMVYDFAGSEVRFEDVISTVDPQECCVWIDPRMRQDLRMFRFRGPPTLTVNGYAQFGGKTDVNLRLNVDAPAGFEYDVIGKWLPVDSARAALLFTFGRLDIRELDARTLGGQLRGNIFVSLRPEDRRFGADLDLADIDFEKFTKLYFNYEGSQGEMRARYKFTALMDNMATMNGEGSAVVTRGNVFAIPVFGPLSGILNAILPGVGFSPAKRAFASFDVRNGVAFTRDMEVQGAGFTMLGEGWLDFVRDRMDFNVRINARGVPGVILFPVSKLFEYTSTSALSNPQWRPKRFSIAPREDRAAGREAARGGEQPARQR